MAELPSSGAPRQSAAAAFPLLQLLRPRQWTKNALLFAAAVFAGELFVPEALALASLAFASFCLASSSVYVVNDLLDVERDRQHPHKRHRPIAAGEVGAGMAGGLAAVLSVAALALAFWIGNAFGVAVITYLAMSHFYSLAGKNVVILDVMLIASGFVIRAVAGALAIQVDSSNWFILCTLFLALFIALSKRKAEMLSLEDDADRARPVLGSYTKSSLDAYTACSMAGVLISYALYVLDIRYTSTESFQLLALTLPFVMFGVFRYHLLVETSEFGERAEEVLLRDRPMQVCILGFAAVALAAIHWAG